MVSGIYKIQNIKTGRIYIGSSIDIALRLRKHLESLRRNGHVNKALQNGFNKHGESSYIFKVILLCSRDSLELYEQKIIDFYKANKKPFGYNSREVSKSNRGMVFDRGTVKPGDKYGRLTFIERYEKEANGKKWLCRCDCGKEITANMYAVKKGGISSCGCLQREYFATKAKHKAGDKYNMLTLVSLYAYAPKDYHHKWLFRCDCGNEKITDVFLVTSGKTTSCGCVFKIKYPSLFKAHQIKRDIHRRKQIAHIISMKQNLQSTLTSLAA